jgi:hypothetical protein
MKITKSFFWINIYDYKIQLDFRVQKDCKGHPWNVRNYINAPAYGFKSLLVIYYEVYGG